MRGCRRTRKFRNTYGRYVIDAQILGYVLGKPHVWSANFGTRLEPYDRCADRTNVRIPKGRRDFPGDNEVINESIVNIYKSVKFRKTADALIMSLFVVMRIKYLNNFISNKNWNFFLNMCSIYYIALLCRYIILIIHFWHLYECETSFLLFLDTFPQYALSSPPYQFHGCNCDLLSFSLSRERRPLKFQP